MILHSYSFLYFSSSQMSICKQFGSYHYEDRLDSSYRLAYCRKNGGFSYPEGWNFYDSDLYSCSSYFYNHKYDHMSYNIFTETTISEIEILDFDGRDRI